MNLLRLTQVEVDRRLGMKAHKTRLRRVNLNPNRIDKEHQGILKNFSYAND